MDLNGFIANFADLFDETDAAVFKADTNYRELDEWSSMIALTVIAMIDSEYDVQLKGDDFRGTKTIEDLFNKVKELKK